MEQSIYKVIGKQEWSKACSAGVFLGAAIDLQDGYIHFSTKSQVEETVAKHFAGEEDLLLIRFPSAAFGDSLKWEVSRGGDLFPHLYASLKPTLADDQWPLQTNADGTHKFPNNY